MNFRAKVNWDAKAVEAAKEELLVAAEQEAVDGFVARFVNAGWRLKLRKVGNDWVAIFFPRVPGQGVTANEVTAPTRLEAAEAAWQTYTSGPGAQSR
jgi:hypothetical protein